MQNNKFTSYSIELDNLRLYLVRRLQQVSYFIVLLIYYFNVGSIIILWFILYVLGAKLLSHFKDRYLRAPGLIVFP